MYLQTLLFIIYSYIHFYSTFRLYQSLVFLWRLLPQAPVWFSGQLGKSRNYYSTNSHSQLLGSLRYSLSTLFKASKANQQRQNQNLGVTTLTCFLVTQHLAVELASSYLNFYGFPKLISFALQKHLLSRELCYPFDPTALPYEKVSGRGTPWPASSWNVQNLLTQLRMAWGRFINRQPIFSRWRRTVMSLSLWTQGVGTRTTTTCG